MLRVGDMVMNVDFYCDRRVGLITSTIKYKNTCLFTDTYPDEEYSSCAGEDDPMTPAEWEEFKNCKYYDVMFFDPGEGWGMGSDKGISDRYRNDDEIVSIRDIKKFILSEV